MDLKMCSLWCEGCKIFVFL